MFHVHNSQPLHLKSSCQNTRGVHHIQFTPHISTHAKYHLPVDLVHHFITRPERNMFDDRVPLCREFTDPQSDQDSELCTSERHSRRQVRRRLRPGRTSSLFSTSRHTRMEHCVLVTYRFARQNAVKKRGRCHRRAARRLRNTACQNDPAAPQAAAIDCMHIPTSERKLIPIP